MGGRVLRWHRASSRGAVSRPLPQLLAGPVYAHAVTETAPDGSRFPDALTEVSAVGFEWECDEETDTARGCDFEPYERFETRRLDGVVVPSLDRQRRGRRRRVPILRLDACGDYTGFWLVRPDTPIHGQLIVFLGSEGHPGTAALPPDRPRPLTPVRVTRRGSRGRPGARRSPRRLTNCTRNVTAARRPGPGPRGTPAPLPGRGRAGRVW